MQVSSDRLRKGQRRMRVLPDATLCYCWASLHSAGLSSRGVVLPVAHVDPLKSVLLRQ